MFCQHSAESAICCLGVRYECNRGGFFVGLGSLCCRFKGSSYLLRSVSIILENGGEKFQFLTEGILVTESFGSVYQGSQDWLFVCRMVMWIFLSLPSHGSPSLLQHRAASPSHTTGHHLGSLPSTASFFTQTCPLPVPPPSDWLRLFLSQTSSSINTPAISSRLFFLLTPPMSMEQTMFRNVSTYNS